MIVKQCLIFFVSVKIHLKALGTSDKKNNYITKKHKYEQHWSNYANLGLVYESYAFFITNNNLEILFGLH